MNIQNPAAKRIYEFSRKDAHVAGETNEIDLAIFQSRHHFAIVLFAAASAAFDNQRFDSALSCLCEPASVLLIADHNGYFRIRNRSIANGVSQCHHVRAPSGNQDRQAMHCHL